MCLFILRPCLEEGRLDPALQPQSRGTARKVLQPSQPKPGFQADPGTQAVDPWPGIDAWNRGRTTHDSCLTGYLDRGFADQKGLVLFQSIRRLTP